MLLARMNGEMNTRTHLSKEELVGCLPCTKATVRDLTWDKRFVNYFIGVRPPAPDLYTHIMGDVFWYDLAEDAVKMLDRLEKGTVWSAKKAKDRGVPRYVIREKDMSLVGRVDEAAEKAKSGPDSLKAFLKGDDDF